MTAPSEGARMAVLRLAAVSSTDDNDDLTFTPAAAAPASTLRSTTGTRSAGGVENVLAAAAIMGDEDLTLNPAEAALASAVLALKHDDQEEGYYGSEYRRTPVAMGAEAMEDDGLWEGWSPDEVDVSKLQREMIFQQFMKDQQMAEDLQDEEDQECGGRKRAAKRRKVSAIGGWIGSLSRGKRKPPVVPTTRQTRSSGEKPEFDSKALDYAERQKGAGSGCNSFREEVFKHHREALSEEDIFADVEKLHREVATGKRAWGSDEAKGVPNSTSGGIAAGSIARLAGGGRRTTTTLSGGGGAAGVGVGAVRTSSSVVEGLGGSGGSGGGGETDGMGGTDGVDGGEGRGVVQDKGPGRGRARGSRGKSRGGESGGSTARKRWRGKGSGKKG